MENGDALYARIAELEEENEHLRRELDVFCNLPEFDLDGHIDIISDMGYEFEDGEWKRDGWTYCKEED